MFDQGPPQSGDSPIVLRASAAVSWAFVVFAVVFAFVLVRGYLGAATTAGRIGTILFMGCPSASALGPPYSWSCAARGRIVSGFGPGRWADRAGAWCSLRSWPGL
jgi:hypothetical protein